MVDGMNNTNTPVADYTVLAADSWAELGNLVQEFLQSGWQPHGGPVTYMHGKTLMRAQAMVKSAPDGEGEGDHE